MAPSLLVLSDILVNSFQFLVFGFQFQFLVVRSYFLDHTSQFPSHCSQPRGCTYACEAATAGSTRCETWPPAIAEVQILYDHREGAANSTARAARPGIMVKQSPRSIMGHCRSPGWGGE
jgi:hypothetical protein